ncbi:hypothetical protein Mal4_25540 [Maioricimonas rarisocia]|uniref:Uncharacterized protein n=1 Tax=Maioricimonas rarisocia TaxID=2528026 RepID=A0A517Z710_9PLAN|nr:hypothetical protein [Maioricimonas rarisocia]QDU38229.1 hypothetical protein Mal4_25540 [Maioricimonas rarisocia]
MNQETPQTPDASSSPAGETAGAEKKSRSPVERVIVYGMIIVLLVLVSIQAHARFGYTMTLNNLKPLIDDDRPDGEPLPITEISDHVVGWPSRSEGEVSSTVKSIEYRWKGLLGKSYGLTLTYNTLTEPYTVQGMLSDVPPEPDNLPADEPEVDPTETEGESEVAPSAPSGGHGSGSPAPAAGGDSEEAPSEESADESAPVEDEST